MCKDNNGHELKGDIKGKCRLKFINMVMILTMFVPFLPLEGYSQDGSSKDNNEESLPLMTLISNLPLAENPGSLKRPNFHTVHIGIGFGWNQSDLSSLEPLDMELSSSMVNIPVYMYLPLSKENDAFFFMGGIDLNLNETHQPTYKVLLFHQTKIHLLFGLGAGRVTFSHYGSINTEVRKNFGLLAFGINLSPQRVDLLVNIPFESSISARFEGRKYTINPAGIQFTLITSLR